MSTHHLVDPMCHDLASHMLQHTKGATDMDKKELAEMLQAVCELWDCYGELAEDKAREEIS